MGANNDLKITVDFQTGKYRPKTDRQYTGQTKSKTLITDLDSSTQPITQTGQTVSKMQTVNNTSKRNPRASKST